MTSDEIEGRLVAVKAMTAQIISLDAVRAAKGARVNGLARQARAMAARRSRTSLLPADVMPGDQFTQNLNAISAMFEASRNNPYNGRWWEIPWPPVEIPDESA